MTRRKEEPARVLTRAEQKEQADAQRTAAQQRQHEVDRLAYLATLDPRQRADLDP